MVNLYFKIAEEALFPAIIIVIFGWLLGVTNIISEVHIDGLN